MRLCYVESVVPEKLFIEPVTYFPNVTAQRIIQVVCKHLNVNESRVYSGTRKMEVTYARHLSMWLMKKHLRFGYKSIAFFLGRKDHTTARAAVIKVYEYIETNYSTTLADIKAIEKILGV